MERLIFHVTRKQCFSFLGSSKKVKMGLPDLRDIPSCIGGNPSKRTGIVVAKSIPAKKYGIQTGEPMAMAFRKCPNLVAVPSDFELYDKCSRAFKKICGSYAPVMESFSIDEVFLDMTGTSYIYPDPVATAHELKDKIRTELGLPVNIGISTNKLLAKMASDFEKPDKVHTLFPEEIPVKMWPLPVKSFFFLADPLKKNCRTQGSEPSGDLAHEKKAKIQALLGEKAGQQLYQYARGLDDSPVKAKPDEAKGFSLETTFNDDLVSLEQALPILLEQCDILAARMRRKKKKCTCISVTFRTLDFRNKSHQTKLPNATDITEEIYRNAQNLFQESWMRQPLRLLGVSLTGLTDDSFEQLSFFEDIHKKERQQKLDAALDSIRLKYGNDKVTRASIMNSTTRIGRKAKAQMENEREQ